MFVCIEYSCLLYLASLNDSSIGFATIIFVLILIRIIISVCVDKSQNCIFS